MTRTAVARAAVVLVTAALVVPAGCKDSTGPGGAVLVSVSGSPAPRAVQFRLVGHQTGVAAAPGSSARVFTSQHLADTVIVVVIAPQGQTLSGALVQVSVPDAGVAVSTYQIAVLQVAAASYLLENPAAYTFRLQTAE